MNRVHALEHRPILGLPERVVRRLRITAFVWALTALAGLLLAGWFDVLRHRPGGDAYEIEQRTFFLIAFAVAIAVSWWSEIIGGTLASLSAAAILVFARNQLLPLDATVIVLVFAVPGLLWILVELHDLRPRAAAAAIALIVLAVGTGTVVAQRTYNDIFGPAHPESELADLPETDVDWMWSGAATPNSFVVVAEVDRSVSSTRLAVATDDALATPVWFAPTASEDHIVRFEVAGLTPSSEYHYALELDGELELDATATIRTFPDGPASFTIAVGSCARVGSNGAVFDAIRELDPLLYVITGDFHYFNIGTNDVDKFVDAYRETLGQNAQAALYRSTAIAYVWDDHDYGPNNADATSASRPAAAAAYRAAVPHYPLAGDDATIHQAFTIGRVRFIMTDTRSGRSPAADPDDADKTILGDEQREWLERELLAADDVFPVIVWVNSVPWISEVMAGGDDWGGYSTERAEIATFVAEHEIDGLVMVSGDAHMVALDDGSNSDYSSSGDAGFPVLHAAALDRPGHTKGGPYSEGAFPGGGQFGVVEVTDDGGDEIVVELSGRTYADEVLVSKTFTFDVAGEP